MNQKLPSPTVLDLAQGLLGYESAARNSSEEKTPAVFRVSEKLRRPLSTLAGATGFRALLARALTLAKVHVSVLSAVQVKPDGSLEGLSEVHNNEAAQAGVMLIAQLVGLLNAFIGEELTLHLLVDLWPDLPVFVAELYREREHDPTK
jgi:hypothetical protein